MRFNTIFSSFGSGLLFKATLYVADLPSRRGLRSSCSDCLVQHPVHRSTVGSRAFSVAGPRVWNCLPPEVTSAPSLATFRTRLETFLFTESYPDIRLIWYFLCLHTVYSGLSRMLNTLQPAPDHRGWCTGSHNDWLACVIALACRLWELKMASTFKRFVIWRSVFLFFGTRSLVKGYG